MIFKGLYEEKEVDEQEWYLKVEADEYGFYCSAVNADRELITPLFHANINGKIGRHRDVLPGLGFDLDNVGRIKLEE